MVSTTRLLLKHIISSPQAISSSGNRRGSGRGGHRHSGHDSGGSTRNSAAAAVFCTRTGPVIDSSRTNWQIWLHPIKRSDCRRVGDHVIVTAPGKTCEESGDFTAISCHGSSGVEGANAGIYDRTAAPGGDGAALFAAATALQSAHQDSRQSDCHKENTHCRGLHTEPISGQLGEWTGRFEVTIAEGGIWLICFAQPISACHAKT